MRSHPGPPLLPLQSMPLTNVYPTLTSAAAERRPCSPRQGYEIEPGGRVVTVFSAPVRPRSATATASGGGLQRVQPALASPWVGWCRVALDAYHGLNAGSIHASVVMLTYGATTVVPAELLRSDGQQGCVRADRQELQAQVRLLRPGPAPARTTDGLRKSNDVHVMVVGTAGMRIDWAGVGQDDTASLVLHHKGCVTFPHFLTTATAATNATTNTSPPKHAPMRLPDHNRDGAPPAVPPSASETYCSAPASSRRQSSLQRATVFGAATDRPTNPGMAGRPVGLPSSEYRMSKLHRAAADLLHPTQQRQSSTARQRPSGQLIVAPHWRGLLLIVAPHWIERGR